MSDPDSIEIPVKFPADTKGVKDSTAALERLLKAQQQVDKATVSNARAQTQLAAEEAKQAKAASGAAQAAQKLATEQQRTAQQAQRVAAESGRAAQQAQRLATETARTTKEMNAASLAAQRQQTELSRTAAAQDRAAQAALRRSRAEQQASRPSTGGARGFAGRVGSEIVGQAGQALGAAALAGGVVGGAALLASGAAGAAQDSLALQQTLNLTRELSGTQERYNLILESARKQQHLYGGTLQENVAGLQGLVVTSRSSGAELEKLINLSQRLSVLDPEQGTAGARVALSEALSGNARSLAMRYEVPLSALRDIEDQSKSAAERLQILDDYLAQIGITSEAAESSITEQAKAYNDLASAFDIARNHLGSFVADLGKVPAQVVTEVIVKYNNTQDPARQQEGREFLDTKNIQRAITMIEQSADGGTQKAKELVEQLQALSTDADPAIAATAVALADMFLLSGDADALTNALDRLKVGSEQVAQATLEAANADAEAAHRAGERNDGVLAAVDADQQAAASLAAKLAETQANEQASRQLAAAERDLSTLGGSVAQGLMTSANAATILAQRYGIAYGEALLLLQAQAALAAGQSLLNAGLQDQRMGERMGGATAAQAQARQSAFDARLVTMRRLEREAAAAKRGGGGGGAASRAEQEARAQDTANERVQDLLNRQADFERDLNRKREEAAAERADKLREIEEELADDLVDIEQERAQDLIDITADAAKRTADAEADAANKRRDIRKKEVADLKAIDDQQAREREDAARGLTNTIAAAGVGLRLSNAGDNLDLAGTVGDERAGLMAREGRQAAQSEALSAAAARAQGMDPTVGLAAFEAERSAIEQRSELQERFAERQEELAGNPAALAELESLYAEQLLIIQEGIDQQIAEATQAQQLRAEAAEAEKAAVIQRAQEEREAVEAEKREQTATIAREAEAQRVKVETEAAAQTAKAKEEAEAQRLATEEAFTKQSEAIDTWATDAETDIQRVIDKLDGLEKKAFDAATAMRNIPSGGEGGSDGAAPRRHSGGPMAMGEAYRVRPDETFVAPDNGYMIPFLPQGVGGSSSLAINLGGISVVAQPGQNERAIADMAANLAVQKITTMMKGRGFN